MTSLMYYSGESVIQVSIRYKDFTDVGVKRQRINDAKSVQGESVIHRDSS